MSLASRRILLGVTGGIAAYKAAELARRLIEAGAEVQVVMTKGARKFIAPLTFQALTHKPVRSTLWDARAEMAMGHIELARWPDAIVVAPATANFIEQLARGSASDLLTTLALATDKPVFVAPAMNRLMWANAATQANVARAKKRGVRILGPADGDQACGEIGSGRLLEPTQIRDTLAAHFGDGPLAGVNVAVTAGPTREPIDPVRVLTNRSSGKMGYAVAAALCAAGAKVTLISGPTALPAPAGVLRVNVETADEMLKASLVAAKKARIFIGTAAVADYRAAQNARQKIKKNSDTLALRLTKTTDILCAVRAKHPKLLMVGFAAETEKLAQHAREKLVKKKLDLVAANLVGKGKAFDRDDNQLHLFWNGGTRKLRKAPKTDLARELVRVIAQRLTPA